MLLEIDGRPAGYALYRIKLEFEEATNKSQVQVLEAIGESPAAMRELWRYLLAIDWVDEIHCDLLPADHPLFLLVQRPNRLDWKVFDGLWLRLVDVGAASRRSGAASDGRVTLDVHADPILPDNVGTWTVEAGAARRSRRRADVRLDVQALAARIPRRLHVRRARARRAGRRGRAGRYRPGRRPVPCRCEAVVPRDLLSRNRTRIATATGPSESAAPTLQRAFASRRDWTRDAYPQTSCATSTTRRSFAHCSSSVRAFPSSVEANPHWGERQSWSSGA